MNEYQRIVYYMAQKRCMYYIPPTKEFIEKEVNRISENVIRPKLEKKQREIVINSLVKYFNFKLKNKGEIL